VQEIVTLGCNPGTFGGQAAECGGIRQTGQAGSGAVTRVSASNPNFDEHNTTFGS